MIKISLKLVLLVSLLLIFSNSSSAQEMEFDFGIAYDNPINEPLPELDGGYGFNFSTCLWVHSRVGIAVGAIGTKHDYNAGAIGNQSFKFDAEKDVIYFEGRYRFIKNKYWGFIGHAGYTFSNNVYGGDETGGYLEFSDSSVYDSERIGYDGDGFMFGLSVNRAIKSFHQNYYLFAKIRYMIINYNSHKFYRIDENRNIEYVEDDATPTASSLSVHIGVILRFDFANF